MTTLLRLENLRAGRGGRTVLGPLSLSVRAGDFIALTGENGAGKSTLLQTMAGVLAPVSGHVLRGEPSCGYVPQMQAAQRDFPASAREIVRSGCAARLGWGWRLSGAEKARADDAMRRLEVLGLADIPFAELSGGQQRRVLLARALTASSRLLLLDEPDAGLDIRQEEIFRRLLAGLHAQGTAVVLVTHDLPPVLPLATRVWTAAAGGVDERVLREPSPEDAP